MDTTNSFSDYVFQAQRHVTSVKVHQELRDGALFGIARYISTLKVGSVVMLCDGRSSFSPADASPSAICAMVFKKEGLPVSLYLGLGLKAVWCD